IKNLIDLKVKVIRCDNGTGLKNKVMNQFCEMKGIKREFSVARTPQQNRVAERKNRTLIEAGRKLALSFMRLFGCPVTILNTLDHLDALTISMNYKPIVARNQTNGNAGTKENIDACQDGKKIVPDQKYILLPLLTFDPLLSKSSKDSLDAGFKPSGEEEKIDSKHPKNEDSEMPNTEEPRVNQEQDANVNSTNNFNTVSLTVNAADLENNVVDENIVYGCIDNPNMPNLEEIIYSGDDEEVGAEADMNNSATIVPVSPIPTTRVHKDHPLEQIIRDIQSAPQTRRMTKNVTEHVELKKVTQAFTDPSWIEAMQDELLQFKLQKVWTLVELPYGKRAIDYDEVFAPVARIEAISFFLAYASFMNFIVYQMDVKSVFLYGTIEEEVYVCQPLGFEDLEFPNKVYKVKQKDDGIFISQDKYVADILKKFDFSTVRTASTHMETNKALLKDKEAADVFQVTPKTSHLHAVKRIFRYLKGHPKLGLWYPRDSPFELEAFSNSDYAGASLDRKSTTGAEYVAAANCCGQPKHIEIRHHFIRDSYEKRLIQVIKIHTDHNVADLLTKAFDTQKPRKAKRTTEISQSSGPIPLVTYETVIKEWEDRMERAATTASSLKAEQDSEAQISFEAASKQSNDPPLSRVNTLRKNNQAFNISATAKAKTVNGERQIQALVDKKKVIITEKSVRKDMGEDSDAPTDSHSTPIVTQPSSSKPQKKKSRSGEDRLQLAKLMTLCTKLQKHILDLEEAKTAQAKEIANLKKREDASKQVRKIADLDADEEVSLIDETQERYDEEMLFDVQDNLQGEEVVAEKEVSVADPVTTAGEVVIIASATTNVDELTLAQTLIEIKAAKHKAITTAATTTTRPKARGVVV
ncbi:ribonuclease H-like domain-containing protein, partial [Tanacetum coccineum]